MKKLLTFLLLSISAYSFAQVSVIKADSIRLGNPIDKGSISMHGKIYMKDLAPGLVFQDSVLVRGANGQIKSAGPAIPLEMHYIYIDYFNQIGQGVMQALDRKAYSGTYEANLTPLANISSLPETASLSYTGIDYTITVTGFIPGITANLMDTESQFTISLPMYSAPKQFTSGVGNFRSSTQNAIIEAYEEPFDKVRVVFKKIDNSNTMFFTITYKVGQGGGNN